RFRTRYQQLYGHFPANRISEVESIRVIVSEQKLLPPVKSHHDVKIPAKPAFYVGKVPVYEWINLPEGAVFKGPALLLNTTSSGFLEAGWELTIGPNRNAVARFT